MAKKNSSAFVCRECGADFTKWQGQCGECGEWNSLAEIRLGGASSGSGSSRRAGYAGAAGSDIRPLSEIDVDEVPRIATGTGELDLVLGGGLVPGSCILIGGEPGAGKSTLLLQTLCALAAQLPALYVTGEESPQQVAMRASNNMVPVCLARRTNRAALSRT